MTREEAIATLETTEYELINQIGSKYCQKKYEAVKMAIKALEQETVSKESYDHEYFLRKELDFKVARLEKQIAEQENCGDAVSRQEVDQNIYDYAESNGLSYANMKNAILDVPSVTPAHVTCKDCCNVNCAYHAQMCDPEEYRPNFYCADAERRKP